MLWKAEYVDMNNPESIKMHMCMCVCARVSKVSVSRSVSVTPKFLQECEALRRGDFSPSHTPLVVHSVHMLKNTVVVLQSLL